MTALDMALLMLAGGMGFFGFMRGFVEEMLSLLAWVVAVVALRLFLAPITDLAGIWMGPGAATSLAAFGGLFALTFFGGKMLAKWVGARTRSSFMGSVDRVLGLGFGVVKGVLVATLAFLAFALGYNLVFGVDAKRPEWMTQARSYPLLRASGRAMTQFIESRRTGPWVFDEADRPAVR